MGKESAKVGQGKAFKEGWIKKDKDMLRANVYMSSTGCISCLPALMIVFQDQVDHGHYS